MLTRRMVKAAVVALAAFELRGLIAEIPRLLELIAHLSARVDLLVVSPALIAVAVLLWMAARGLALRPAASPGIALRVLGLWAALSATLMLSFSAYDLVTGHLGLSGGAAAGPGWLGLPAAVAVAGLVTAVIHCAPAVFAAIGPPDVPAHWVVGPRPRCWSPSAPTSLPPLLCRAGTPPRGPPLPQS